VRFGPLPESTLIARKLGGFEAVLVAAPSYLARRPGADERRGARGS